MLAATASRTQLVRECIYAAYYLQDNNLDHHLRVLPCMTTLGDVGVSSALAQLADAKGLLVLDLLPPDAPPDASAVLLLHALQSDLIRTVFVPALSRAHSAAGYVHHGLNCVPAA